MTGKADWYKIVLLAMAKLVNCIKDCEEPCGCGQEGVRVVFAQVQGNGLIIKGDIKSMELREGQQVRVSADLQTSAGHQAAYQEGSASWESSNPDVATVTADPNDELTAVVKGVNGEDNESVVISFQADGDPDSDQERVLVGTVDITVTQGEATVVSLSVGQPEDTFSDGTPTTGGGTDSGTGSEPGSGEAPATPDTENPA